MTTTLSKVTGAAIISVAYLLVFTSFFTVEASAAEKQDKPKPAMTDKIGKSESPIHITADRMEARQQERLVIFEGHVVVTQDDVTLTGNRLKVIGLPDDNKSKTSEISEKIDYIEIEGDVKVIQKDRTATADKGIYYQKDQKIILRGRPVVTRGNDRITGSVITVYLQQGKSIVEGGKEAPVQAILSPGKKD